MTPEEKATLCSGLDFWHFQGIDRLDIPSIKVADGPHGLNTRVSQGEEKYNVKVPATCFPTAVNLASSWDRALLEEVGAALSEECHANGVSLLLGPGVNIKRSPLCGRNFEYFSEDPYLSGELAAAMIKGLQDNGTGACIKHFAANNREERRHTADSQLDERTLHEIYLPAFEKAVKEAAPWAVMAAYNRLNGDFCCENAPLLKETLRERWQFDGIVISDWYAVNDRVKGLAAGLDIEMPPGDKTNDKAIVSAVKEGVLREEQLDEAVLRILKVLLKAESKKRPALPYEPGTHHSLARRAAAETMVLLKNQGSLLPLKEGQKVALIGQFAKRPRYQGTGSSRLEPLKLENLYDELKALIGTDGLSYADGYSQDPEEVDTALLAEALKKAREADVALLCVGLPESYEKEGWDRAHMKLPLSHIRLIESVAKIQPNTVVLLSNGAPVEMPWLDSAKAVLETYLGGQAGAGATADLLTGRVNPCGKLAETFPIKLSDNPSYLDFNAYPEKVAYGEGIYVGYRYYEKMEREVLFPFGFGLSYTRFTYSDLHLSNDSVTDTEGLTVSLKVKNTGSRAGKEVVQLYVRDLETATGRPEKELKGFAKVFLEPGEEKEISFFLDRRAFACYDTDLHDWHVESGEFMILAGSSSSQPELEKKVYVEGTVKKKVRYTVNSAFADIAGHPAGKPIYDYIMSFSALTDIQLGQMHLRSLTALSKGHFTGKMLEELLKALNSL